MKPQRLPGMWKYEGMAYKQWSDLIDLLDAANFTVDDGKILPKIIPKGYSYSTFGEYPLALGMLFDNDQNDICLTLQEPIGDVMKTCWSKVRSICDRIS